MREELMYHMKAFFSAHALNREGEVVPRKREL
jgi:hypothetical protein